MSKDKITDECIIDSLRDLDNSINLPQTLKNVDVIVEAERKRKKKGKNRILYAAASFLLVIFLGTAPALSKTLAKIFEPNVIDNGVIKAQDSNKVSTIDKVAEHDGVKVTLKGAVSDEVRTVISIRFDSKAISFDDFNLSKVSLSDSDGRKYELSHYGQGERIDGAGYIETSMEFKGAPSKKTTVKLNIGKINNIQGNWSFDFDISPSKIENYKTDASYNDGKIAMNITNVSFTATYTIVEGKTNYHNYEFHSFLSGHNGQKVEEISAEGQTKEDSIVYYKIYFPPLDKTDELNLTIVKSITDNTPILSVKIPLKK